MVKELRTVQVLHFIIKPSRAKGVDWFYVSKVGHLHRVFSVRHKQQHMFVLNVKLHMYPDL